VALSLADALFVGHGESDADAEALAAAVGVSVAPADDDADPDGSVAPADALADSEAPDEGLPDPVHAVGDEVEAAIPEVAGITSRAPIATVPVATAPTTEAADRLLRACLGTVVAPN
jgi:hypothetical protein